MLTHALDICSDGNAKKINIIETNVLIASSDVSCPAVDTQLQRFV